MQENEFPIIEPLKGQINFNLKNDIFLNFIKKHLLLVQQMNQDQYLQAV